LRTIRIAAPAQLPLGIAGTPADRWWSLPEEARQAVLRALAAMIAAGVAGEGLEADDVEN
jgi:hypothetical protein